MDLELERRRSLQALRLQLKRLKQVERREGSALRLSEAKLMEALLVVWRSNGNLEMGLERLRRHFVAMHSERERKRQHKSLSLSADTTEPDEATLPEEWKAELTSRWAAWSTSDEAEAMMASPKKLQQARLFVVGMELKSWIQKQNSRALAPSPAAVCNQQRRLLRRWQGGKTTDAIPVVSARAKWATQKWVGRWAKAERLQRGKFKLGPALTVEQAREKASGLCVVPKQLLQFWQDVCLFLGKMATGKWKKYCFFGP